MPGLPIHHQLPILKLMSIKLVMPSNHLILCHPPPLQPSILPSIRVLLNELVLPIRWPKYQSFSFSSSPSNEYSGLISFRIDWLDHSIWSHHFMTNRWGSKGNSVRLFWGGPPKSLQMVTAATKLKDTCSLEESCDQPKQHIKKQRHYFANKDPSSQIYGFSSGHVWM